MLTLTPRLVGELLHHEGLVREAYRDSAGVWTWSVGITSASGHRVERYRDSPQSIARCLEVFVWLLTARYLPAVLAACGGFVPQEHQLAAAGVAQTSSIAASEHGCLPSRRRCRRVRRASCR